MKRLAARRTIAWLSLALCVWLLWPAQSLGRALIRFIQALPGVGETTVEIGGGQSPARVGTLAFGQVTGWHGLRTGRFKWSLVSGARRFAHGTATVGDGAYDVVLLDAGPLRVGLGVYRARAGRAGASLIRVIHAAPELGVPALRLGDRSLAAGLRYTHATGYIAVTPGEHELLALAGRGSAPLVPGGRLALANGRAYTAVLVGSQGERLRWVTVTDRGGPLTRPKPLRHQYAGPRRPAAAAGSVVVAPGDSLWSIAAAQLGPHASDEQVWSDVVAIWRLNAARIGTGDPNLIFPGQRLALPRRR